MISKIYSIKFISLFAISIGVFITPIYAKQPEWLKKVKKIEILKTAKGEVEKLFGNPKIIETRDLAIVFKNGWGKEIKYETKYGNLEVWYAAGKCSKSRGIYAYDIDADVVAAFTFFPNEIALENQLGYDLNKFEVDSDSDTDKTYSFEDEKSKITIEVKNFQVYSIEFEISDKYKTRLECQNTKVKEPVWLEKLRTLEIFKSTRNDVEALFDNPQVSEINDSVKDSDDWLIEVEYKTIYGEIQADYSTGNCFERQSKYGYDAEKDTLVRLKFIPIVKVDPTEINFDMRKLRAGKGRELGVEVYLYDTKVEYIQFYPNEKQEGLDCEKVLNLQK
jgi:hypothetical protein